MNIRSGWKPDSVALGNNEPLFSLPAEEGTTGPAVPYRGNLQVRRRGGVVRQWCTTHYSDLENLLGVDIASISWLAADIAPVGHLCQRVATSADRGGEWVFVATANALDAM